MTVTSNHETGTDRLPAIAIEEMATVCKWLSDEYRLRIILQISRTPTDVAGLSAMLGVSQPVVSHHLAILHRGGAVRYLRQGKRHIYTLTNEGREKVSRAFAMVCPSSDDQFSATIVSMFTESHSLSRKILPTLAKSEDWIATLLEKLHPTLPDFIQQDWDFWERELRSTCERAKKLQTIPEQAIMRRVAFEVNSRKKIRNPSLASTDF